MKCKYSKMTALSLTALMLVACGEEEALPETPDNSYVVEQPTQGSEWETPEDGDGIVDETDVDWGVTEENVEEVIEDKGIEEVEESDAWYVYKDKDGKEVKKSKYSMVAQKEFEKIKQLILNRTKKEESAHELAKQEADRIMAEEKAKEEQARKEYEEMQKEMEDYMTGGHILQPPLTEEKPTEDKPAEDKPAEEKEPLKLKLPPLFKFEFPTLAKADKKIEASDFHQVSNLYPKEDLMYHLANVRSNLILNVANSKQLDVPKLIEEAIIETPGILLIDEVTYNSVAEATETVYYINVKYTLTKEEYGELVSFAEDFEKKNASLSAVEKVKLLNKTISNLGDYSTDLSKPNIFSPYTLYSNKEGVCQAYASLGKLVLDAMGFENRIVTGSLDGVPHVWNELFINEEVKQIDFTLNDIMGNEDYLLVTPEEMAVTHEVD